MKPTRQRSGPFLCFGAPDLEERSRRPAKSSTVGSEGSEDEPKICRRRRRLHRRILSKLIQSGAIISSNSDRSGKLPEKLCRSLVRKGSGSSDGRSAPESSVKSSYDDDRRADSIFSSSSSLSSSSSSCSSSISSGSSSSFRAAEPKPERKRNVPFMEGAQKPTGDPKNYGCAAGLCLMLLSLSVMVFCGRLWAIILTSTWLCFTPCWSPGGARVAEYDVAVVGPPGLRARGWREEEKKRVVMEGLLDRSRSRRV